VASGIGKGGFYKGYYMIDTKYEFYLRVLEKYAAGMQNATPLKVLPVMTARENTES